LRSKTSWSVKIDVQYQEIDEEHCFDMSNLDNYDVILGMPFWYQHQLMVGVNPARVIVGSNESLAMKGAEVNVVSSAAADIFEEDIKKIQQMLVKEATDLCPDTAKTALPPLRAVNHTIPLVEEDKVY
jgi:hypothetical protein